MSGTAGDRLVVGPVMYGNHFGWGVGLPPAALEEAGDVGVARDPEDFDLLAFALDLLT